MDINENADLAQDARDTASKLLALATLAEERFVGLDVSGWRLAASSIDLFAADIEAEGS